MTVAVEILANLVRLAASPGGLAILERLFSDHGITLEKVAAAVKQMPTATAPRKD